MWPLKAIETAIVRKPHTTNLLLGNRAVVRRASVATETAQGVPTSGDPAGEPPRPIAAGSIF
jgi:hypothetical protein